MIYLYVMQIKSYQKRFLEILQSKMPKGEILANLLCTKLHISKDSAYRRLRGETSLTFDELIILANHFEVSLDTFLQLENNQSETLFHHKLFDHNITEYINWVIDEFTAPNFFQNYEMIYAAKGLPIYYNLLFPEIAVFKAFYYNKILWKNSNLVKEKFDLEEAVKGFIKNPGELLKIRNKILMPYLKTPSCEIWNQHTFDGHMHQLRFAIGSGMFKNTENERLIINKTKELLHYCKNQAEEGKKINPDNSKDSFAPYTIYYSETVNLEHSFWKNSNESKGAYTIQNIGDFIYTFDESFCDRSENYLRNLIEKSTLISHSNDVIRHKLFRKIERQIEAVEDLE